MSDFPCPWRSQGLRTPLLVNEKKCLETRRDASALESCKRSKCGRALSTSEACQVRALKAQVANLQRQLRECRDELASLYKVALDASRVIVRRLNECGIQARLTDLNKTIGEA